MATSYNGKILHVDLGKLETWIEEPPGSFYRMYGGGSGMGTYYVLRDTPPGIDAFAPENVLALFPGIATGLAISGQSRITANAKSPLTGGIGDAQAGGFFPAEFKMAGFDGIVITGKAPHPVYLWLHDGQAEIHDASQLWGKLAHEAEDLIREELGDKKVEVLQIGPAGEKLSRIACLMNMCNRANGRTGMGAVMGSKNLRAVAVRGKKRMEAALPAELSALRRQGIGNMKTNPAAQGLQRDGTNGGLASQHFTGTLPTRNWSESQFEDYEKITGETMTNTILTENDTCFGCIIRCKRVVKTEFDGVPVEERYGGPEYETAATLGSYCGVSDLDAVALANQLCNAYGLDTIGCGATISFAMDCFENGLITTEDTGGIELRFGNAAAMVRMVELIGKREGFGDVLAEGSERAAQRIGKNAADYLTTVKAAESPAHMPQAKKTLGLIYAVNPYGADHESHEHDPNYETGAAERDLENLAKLGLTTPQEPGSMNAEKIRYAFITQKFYSALDAYSLCNFVWGPSWQLYGPDEVLALLRAATGWDLTMDELLLVGERRLNMMRAFNAREGFTRSDDVYPQKYVTPLRGTGPTAGVYMDPEDLEEHKDIYFRMAGWDVESGNPGPEKLAQLQLEWVKL